MNNTNIAFEIYPLTNVEKIYSVAASNFTMLKTNAIVIQQIQQPVISDKSIENICTTVVVLAFFVVLIFFARKL